MSVRAVFTRFDHFMTMFVAMFGVFWSTAFMPMLGGPLHTYEARAIGAGWESLRTGEASTIAEAFDFAASLPAEAVFPAAHAGELHLASAAIEPAPLELLGGPDVEFPSMQRLTSRVASRVTPVSARIQAQAGKPACAADVEPEDCEGGGALGAST